MAHYAKVSDGIVTRVILAEQEYIDNLIDDSPGEWIQTSYNTRGGVHYGQDNVPDGGIALRKNFAGIGFSYDRDLDAFFRPKPYESWLLSTESADWEAPVPCPDPELKNHMWDENNLSWLVV